MNHIEAPQWGLAELRDRANQLFVGTIKIGHTLRVAEFGTHFSLVHQSDPWTLQSAFRH